MQFDFYIVNHSFEYRNKMSKDEIENKIKSLSIDYDYIRQYKETDKIYVNPDIYDAIIFPELTICDVLYVHNKGRKHFDRDIIASLGNIIDKSEETSLSTKEVVDKLPGHNKNKVYGLLCLHPIEGIDKQYLVYNKNNWLDFHRYFLSIYSHDASFFIDECKKYYPELFFHENNYQSIKAIISDSIKTVIHYLNELSENFLKCKLETNNRIDLLKKFNSISNFDLDASLEGNIKRKKELTFNFINNRKEDVPVYCELHLKLLYDDNRKLKQNRIYFHEGKDDIEEGKMLIGHIGKHL